jgi:hypothetical protein
MCSNLDQFEFAECRVTNFINTYLSIQELDNKIGKIEVVHNYFDYYNMTDEEEDNDNNNEISDEDEENKADYIMQDKLLIS